MKIREQQELYEWRKECVEKKRGEEYEKQIRKKMFYMKRWELLKEEKKKHSAELIKEHNKRRMIAEWARFIKVGLFCFDFKKCFDKEVAKAEWNRKKETASNLIRLRWRIFKRLKLRFSQKALAPLLPLRNIKFFIGCLYAQPKRLRAGQIIHSYLLEKAARDNIFSSFVKYCQRASIIQRKWRDKLKRYSKIFTILENIWSGERARMMKEFVKQRKSKIKKESSLVTMISDEVKEAVLTQYLRACRVRWVKAFKIWYKENEKIEAAKRNTIYSVRSQNESVKGEKKEEEKKHIAIDYKRAGDDSVRSFEALGLNSTRLQKIITQGFKKTMNVNSTLILPSVADPPQVRRASQFATSLKNNLSAQQRSTSMMASMNQNQKGSPKRADKSSQNQTTSKKSSSLAPIAHNRLNNSRVQRASLISSKSFGLRVGVPRGQNESRFKRAGESQRKEAVNSGDQEDIDEIYRRASGKKDEKGGGIAFVFKDRAPQLVWKPSQGLTRELVKIASRLQNSEEVYEAFKP